MCSVKTLLKIYFEKISTRTPSRVEELLARPDVSVKNKFKKVCFISHCYRKYRKLSLLFFRHSSLSKNRAFSNGGGRFYAKQPTPSTPFPYFFEKSRDELPILIH